MNSAFSNFVTATARPPVRTEHSVRIKPYGTRVRVMCRPAAAPSCDLVVQVADGLTWQDIRSFNDFSDDLAHTHADTLARQLQKERT